MSADEKPSILLLNLYMVHPPDSGAKVVLFNRIVELSKAFRVTFCCLAEHESDADGAQALRRHAEVVVARGAWRERALLARAWALLREPSATEFAPKLDAWFDSDDLRGLLARPFDLVEVHSSCWYRPALGAVDGVRVLVAHNREVDYYAARARAAFALNGLRAGLRAALDAVLVAAQERRAVAAADAVVSLAPLDATLARRWLGARPVLCNWGGVDLERYHALATAPVERARRGPVLVFVGALFVEAAVEAAALFVRDALPAIARAHPDVRLVLVGDHRGDPTIARLAAEHASIEVTGLVPDVRPYLAAADVVIAPIVAGSGVRYKIMEAMAAARPVVATHKAAEGLGLVHGDDALLCDAVAAMAPLVLRLLADPELRAALARRGLATARARFDRETEHRRLAAWYRDELLPRARRRSG